MDDFSLLENGSEVEGQCSIVGHGTSEPSVRVEVVQERSLLHELLISTDRIRSNYTKKNASNTFCFAYSENKCVIIRTLTKPRFWDLPAQTIGMFAERSVCQKLAVSSRRSSVYKTTSFAKISHTSLTGLEIV